MRYPFLNDFLTLFRMGLLRLLTDVGPKRLPLFKICHTHIAKIKLGTVIPYLKNTQ